MLKGIIHTPKIGSLEHICGSPTIIAFHPRMDFSLQVRQVVKFPWHELVGHSEYLERNVCVGEAAALFVGVPHTDADPRNFASGLDKYQNV